MVKQSGARVKERIGARISEIRRAAGETQEQVADRLDVSVQWISRLENAHENPSVEALVRIANALDVDVSALFQESGNVAGLPAKVPRRPRVARRRR